MVNCGVNSQACSYSTHTGNWHQHCMHACAWMCLRKWRLRDGMQAWTGCASPQVQCHFIHSPASMTAALKSPSFHQGQETLLQQRVASTKIRGETPTSLVKPHVPTYLWRNASCCCPQLIDINKDGCIIICSHGMTPLQPGIWILVTHWQIGQLAYRHSSSVLCHFSINNYVKLKRFNLNLKQLCSNWSPPPDGVDIRLQSPVIHLYI